MIVYTLNNLKCFEIRAGEPKSDWTGNAEFIIDETVEQNAELIEKIKEYAPYFDYVTDDNGNLIDVIQNGEKEPVPEYIDPVVELRNEIDLLKAQNKALTQSNQFLEDCLVEMAEFVYA